MNAKRGQTRAAFYENGIHVLCGMETLGTYFVVKLNVHVFAKTAGIVILQSFGITKGLQKRKEKKVSQSTPTE